jgi:hypothetical protein
MSTLPTKRKYKLVDISEPQKPAKKAWGSERPPTIVPWRRQNNHNEVINDWFYSRWEDNISPYMFAHEVAGRFEDFLKKTDLELYSGSARFRNSLFSAVCTVAYNDWYKHKHVGAPKGLQPLPKGWSSQTIMIWQDFIQSFYLTDRFFEQFWHNIPAGLWEVEFENIRNYLQSILVFYIKYDNELLKENELIAVISEGEWVDPIEADINEHEEDYD